MNIKDRIIAEANNYFERNKDALGSSFEASKTAKLAGEFFENYHSAYPGAVGRVLEIGCCYGYNLNYLSNKLGAECCGIEPSDKAVEFGNSLFGENEKVHIVQGISSSLPYDSAVFDAVIIGFCLYITPREIIEASISEADRVLKHGGFIVLTDFDTPVNFKRVNKHDPEMFVYKEDYAKRFLPLGYTLIRKTTYTHSKDCFDPDVQERVSTQFLYKEKLEDLYAEK